MAAFFIQYGIIPPRFNKAYREHQSAEIILETGQAISTANRHVLGVGLTDSDVDLLDVCRQATREFAAIEFIKASRPTATSRLGRCAKSKPSLSRCCALRRSICRASISAAATPNHGGNRATPSLSAAHSAS